MATLEIIALHPSFASWQIYCIFSQIWVRSTLYPVHPTFMKSAPMQKIWTMLSYRQLCIDRDTEKRCINTLILRNIFAYILKLLHLYLTWRKPLHWYFDSKKYCIQHLSKQALFTTIFFILTAKFILHTLGGCS
jgi:hypothetical protein